MGWSHNRRGSVKEDKSEGKGQFKMLFTNRADVRAIARVLLAEGCVLMKRQQFQLLALDGPVGWAQWKKTVRWNTGDIVDIDRPCTHVTCNRCH